MEDHTTEQLGDENFGDENPAPRRMGATLSESDGILEQAQALELAKIMGTTLLEDKCEDVVILDVTKLSPVTGYIVIGSGTSARQMRSGLENLDDVAREHGTSAYHISEDDSAIWLLADFIDVVVHLFEPNARSHYDIETLWDDAPRIEVPKPSRPSTPPGRPA